MTSDFHRRLATLRATVQSIDERLASGNIRRGDVEGLKKAVDELRLRIWASMSAASSEDAHVLERFRVRSASEAVLALAEDLERGRLPRDLPELKRLSHEARRLLAQLEGDAA